MEISDEARPVQVSESQRVREKVQDVPLRHPTNAIRPSVKGVQCEEPFGCLSCSKIARLKSNSAHVAENTAGAGSCTRPAPKSQIAGFFAYRRPCSPTSPQLGHLELCDPAQGLDAFCKDIRRFEHVLVVTLGQFVDRIEQGPFDVPAIPMRLEDQPVGVG